MLTTNFDTGELSHELELSARYHQDEEDRFQQDDRYQMVNGRMILTSAGAPGSQSNRLNEAKAWAFFARDTIEAGPFTFVPGLRYESINLDQTNWGSADPGRNGPTTAKQSYVDVFIPGLSATWSATDEVLLVAGVHRGFASPAPGSDVDPETSWNYESGVKYDSDGWRAGAIGFINSYSNLLGTCTASTGGNCTIGDQFEGGEVSVKGIELTVGRTFGSIDSNGFQVPVTLAYTYTNARFRSSFESDYDLWGEVTAGDELPYTPPHQITLGVGLEMERARLNTLINWVDVARATAGSGPVAEADRVDSRILVDLSAEYDLSPNVKMYGVAQNLFNKTYNAGFSPSGARPGAPLTVMAGIRSRF
ncbi:TonB-dependent receptor family protein [Sinorhizobium meliloti]|uniref:TonB-dependent receptor family protein n=1 Tax=Rhizobium meliloti TaxID=382 RepID=UPI001F425966|nr:TonB-dependent receptor [Sinorhizobium meliloti]